MESITRLHVKLVATSALVAVMATAQEMPLLHLGRLPDAFVQVCKEKKPFLIPAGGEAVVFLPSDGRIWLARSQPLEEPRIEVTPAMVRPFAVAYEPYSRTFAVAAFEDPGKKIVLFIFENGKLKLTEPLPAPPIDVVFWQGDPLVAFHPSGPWRSLKTFPHLQRLDLGKVEWSTVLSVGPPSWAAEEETGSKDSPTPGAGAPQPSGAANQAPSEGTIWSCGLPVARRDGRLWWVNMYDGTVRLLSKSGAEEWKGQLAGVSRRRLSPAEREERLEKTQSLFPGASAKTIVAPTLLPVVTRIATYDNDLVALVTASPGSPRGGVVVLRDLDRESHRFAFENGETPNRVAVGNDGTVWFANPWGTVPGAALSLSVPPVVSP